MDDANPVVHFEMPYDDMSRVAKFYARAFGWRMQLAGEDMGNYVSAETTTTEHGRPTTAGAINGGFFPRRADWPAQHPSIVIAVGDIHAAMTSVSEAGGELLGDPVSIPGIGEYVSFTDSEGNRVSLLEPRR